MHRSPKNKYFVLILFVSLDGLHSNVLPYIVGLVNTPHNPKKIANKRFMVDLC